MSLVVKESWPEVSEGFLPGRAKPGKEVLPKRVGATVGFLTGCVTRRPAGRRGIGVVSILLALAGVGMLSYPFATQIWAKRIQSGLRKEVKEFAAPQAVQAYKNKQVAVGKALTRLRIPKLRVNVVVVEGVTGNALRAGAGHYDSTPLPGDPGNVAIAGHRTGFGQPFRHIDKLRRGDLVILETPIGAYTYEVVPAFDGHPNPWITHARDFSVLAPTLEPTLTLTTCDPPNTSKNRLIVRLKLVKSELAVI